MKIGTITEAEYEILKAIINKVDFKDLRDKIGDSVSLKRFDKGAENVANLINNLKNRRIHRLPRSHPDYEWRGE